MRLSRECSCSSCSDSSRDSPRIKQKRRRHKGRGDFSTGVRRKSRRGADGGGATSKRNLAIRSPPGIVSQHPFNRSPSMSQSSRSSSTEETESSSSSDDRGQGQGQLSGSLVPLWPMESGFREEDPSNSSSRRLHHHNADVEGGEEISSSSSRRLHHIDPGEEDRQSPCSSSSLRPPVPEPPEESLEGSRRSSCALHTPSPAQTVADKYKYSGVGRFFGKSRSVSELGDEDWEGPQPMGPNEELWEWLWRMRAGTLVLVATCLVLSIFSLLFVFPLVVDPILLGIQARFSRIPVPCRTVGVRHAKGPSECALPSCRAGCTADLFDCVFIDVQYELEKELLDSYHPMTQHNLTSHPQNSTQSLSHLILNFPQNQNSTIRNATLYININGCGYPPAVNCSTFLEEFGRQDRIYSCYFSTVNGSVVVPHYNHREERVILIVALSTPLAVALLSAILLLLVIKCPQRHLLKKTLSLKEEKLASQVSVTSSQTRRPSEPQQAWTTTENEKPKANGVIKSPKPYVNGNANGHPLLLRNSSSNLSQTHATVGAKHEEGFKSPNTTEKNSAVAAVPKRYLKKGEKKAHKS